MNFTFFDDGIYTVTVDVQDDDGGSGFASMSVTVQNEPPVVDAGPDMTADEGSGVQFIGSFFDPGVMDTHTFEWDFGDGTAGLDTLTPAHSYTDDGVYTVTLRVADDDGAVAFDTLTVTVVNKPPVVDIEF